MVTFTDWLKKNPPPDLEALAVMYDGAGLIPDEDARAYERDMRVWQLKLSVRHERGVYPS